MKRTFFYIIVPLLLCACQKEIDNPNEISGNKLVDGNKLVHAISKNGNDSIIVDYYYNSPNTLIGYSATGKNNSGPININITWNRNPANIITTKILKSPAFVAIGIDSMVTSFGYSIITRHYIYARTETKLNGFLFIDSTLYNYDDANRVVSAYHSMTIKGNTVPVEKTEYSYAGNNLVMLKQYKFNESSKAYTLDFITTNEYDKGANPVWFPEEAIPLEIAQYYSENNIIKTSTVYADAPDKNTSISTAYTYNDGSRPVSGVVTGYLSGTVFYYYQ